MSLKRAYLLILAAFVWLILGGVITSLINPPTPSAFANVLFGGLLITFIVIFLAGSAVWAGAKGYHPLLGVVLGWLGPLGLLILVVLTDRSGDPPSDT